jgi:RHS repeat-associated protein
VNTAAKEESTSGLLAVLLETRVRGSAPKNTTDISPEPSVSSTLRWDSWQAYDRTAVERLVGLDFFGVRYISSAQGRFTSPDPLVWQSWQNGNDEERAKFQEFISDPQNFNLYTYGRNNPLKYNDPTGLDVEVAITFVGDVTDEEKKRIIGAVRTYLLDKNVGKVVVRDAADSSQDKRTFGQKVKDFFGATEYHSITVDFAHPNPYGNNADQPNFVKAVDMARSGEDNFGDLRKSDPTQWSNIVAWRVLHETISHAFGIGPDSDQLYTIKPGDARYGTLIQGAYFRGRPGIPGLNPADTQALQKLLIPRTRSYVP